MTFSGQRSLWFHFDSRMDSTCALRARSFSLCCPGEAECMAESPARKHDMFRAQLAQLMFPGLIIPQQSVRMNYYFPRSSSLFVDDLWIKLDKKTDTDILVSSKSDEFLKKVVLSRISELLWMPKPIQSSEAGSSRLEIRQPSYVTCICNIGIGA